jgi:hypothetical protein
MEMIDSEISAAIVDNTRIEPFDVPVFDIVGFYKGSILSQPNFVSILNQTVSLIVFDCKIL